MTGGKGVAGQEGIVLQSSYKVAILRMHLGRAELWKFNQRNSRLSGKKEKKKNLSEAGVLRESILGVHELLPSEV